MGSPDNRHLIDTNVWIDALAGRLSKAVFIKLSLSIRKTGRIKVPDAIIAATALEKNSFLVTRNFADFKDIVGLKLIDPYSVRLATTEDAGVSGV